MNDYNYLEEMEKDIRYYINDDITLADFSDREELEEHLNEVLFTDDTVTGNGSGSYTFSSYRAEECICHNLDYLMCACEAFGISKLPLCNPEECDVLIRCYLLNEAIATTLDDMKEELDEAFEKNEE